MKLVSLLAPPDVAAKSIRDNYAGLVDPKLIEQWASTPASAPGRQVSSPWPDRIEIGASSTSGSAVVIRGTLVEATSTGDAGRLPVQLRLERSGDSWVITKYETGEVNADAEGAVAVVRNYYAAIANRDYDRAYRYWGSTGPPNQNRETFAKGFANTATVHVETGEPSRIEGAAGSRYIDVPVVINATTRSGEAQRFSGTYTLRRSVVDGASAADRAWHLDRASLR